VLYGKLRPYLNKVALPDFAGRCTTEVIPLLPKPELDKTYLCWLLRRTDTVAVAMRDVTGSRMPRADMSAILKHEIPLPPLPEQRRIAAILKEQMAAVDKARAAAEARLEAVKALPAAFLRHVFPLPGQPLPEGWKWTKLGTLIADTRNGFGRRPQPGEDGPVVLRLADVSKGVIDLSNPRRGLLSDKEFETYSLHAGDLLFVRVNGSADIVGRSIMVEPDHHKLVFNDHLIRVRLSKNLLPNFLRVYCDAPIARQHFVDSASTSAGQLTINRASLDSLPLPLPPLPEQRRVVAMLKGKLVSAEKARAAAEPELAAINALPAALLRRAFNGGL
jgi:type I restriction enzyme S subunit